ncbi:MAG: D-alanyl-D-alanine carboxypeptidase family protein, partial [Nitratireductor sp.]
IALEDLIRGVIVQSANDGAIAIAEGLAGSEAAFSNLMNERARKIGMKSSTFKNATGLPDEAQHVTVHDLAKLAQHVISQYPQHYAYYAEPSFTWNKIEQRNRNPLLSMNIGADGFKTGFTEASGYAIIGSAVRDGQRLIAVLSGMKSKKERAEEGRKILDWGFRAFEKLSLFGGEEELAEVSVYGGDLSSVGVSSGSELEIFLPVGNRDRLKARVAYQYPLLPPISKGDQIATLKIWLGDVLTQETPLYALEDVNQGGLKRRSIDAIQELLTSWIPN